MENVTSSPRFAIMEWHMLIWRPSAMRMTAFAQSQGDFWRLKFCEGQGDDEQVGGSGGGNGRVNVVTGVWRGTLIGFIKQAMLFCLLFEGTGGRGLP